MSDDIELNISVAAIREKLRSRGAISQAEFREREKARVQKLEGDVIELRRQLDDANAELAYLRERIIEDEGLRRSVKALIQRIDDHT